MADLLRDLENHFGKDHTYMRASDWPKSIQKAGRLLGTFIPPLKRCGYIVSKSRATDASRMRIVEITKP